MRREILADIKQLKGKKMKENKKQITKLIFKGYSFGILSDSMDQEQIVILSDIIKQRGGKVTTLSCGSASKKPIKCKFLFVQPTQNAQTIKEILSGSIVWEEMLDYHYIYKCLDSSKMIPSKEFKLQSFEMKSQKKKQQAHEEDKMSENSSKTQKMDEEESPRKKDITIEPMNKYIIQQLQKLYKVYANEGDKGRKIAYSRAITSLKSYDKQIKTDEDIQQLKIDLHHIGPKLIDKMKELLHTGSIQKLESLKKTDKNLAAEQLTRVWGIGSAKAKQLYALGIKNIDMLREEVRRNPDILTKNQKIGLKYLEDLEIRIPRGKVTQMFGVIRQIFYDLVGSTSSHDIEVCGSYRRGKETCGDMDVFIARKDGQYEANLLTKFVNELHKKGFLIDHLTMPRHVNPQSCQSYMGICKYKNDQAHRIDIKYYPIDQFAYAVLYFTGSDMFNRKMRLEAMNLGYHLSDHGMYKCVKEGTKVTQTGPNIRCKAEKEIFEILGLEYKEPKDRSL